MPIPDETVDSALARRLGGPVRASLVVTMCSVLAIGGYVGVQAVTRRERPNVDRAFAGTVLERATVRGRWMHVLVNDVGAQFLSFLEDNRAFYSAVTRNAQRAVRRAHLPHAGDTLVTVLLVEGLKCNEGMMGVVGSLADELEPAFVLSAGDDSLTSAGLEQLCVDALASAVRGHAVVVAPGNHDSAVSRAAMHAHGFTVLHGEPVARAGLVILGDGDPRVEESLGTSTQVRPETVGEMAGRLARVACEDPAAVDLTVVNQPAGLEQVIADGCTRLAVAGGTERDLSLRLAQNGRVVPRYLAASAGGAVYDASASLFSTLGPLRAPAEMTLLTISRASGRPLEFHVLTISTDETVVVSPPTLLPYGATAAGQRELAQPH